LVLFVCLGRVFTGKHQKFREKKKEEEEEGKDIEEMVEEVLKRLEKGDDEEKGFKGAVGVCRPNGSDDVQSKHQSTGGAFGEGNGGNAG